MRKAVIAAIALTVSVWTAEAEVVGTTVIDGRVVTLNADQTWQYADEKGTQTRCSVFHPKLKFCGPSDFWKVTSKLSPDASASFRHSDREYLMIIAEDVGTNVGMSLDLLTNAAIENAAIGTGVSKDQIPIYDVEDGETLGTPSRTMAYGVNIDGLDVTYVNTTMVSSDLALQFISFSVSNSYGAAEKALHQNALSYLEGTDE